MYFALIIFVKAGCEEFLKPYIGVLIHQLTHIADSFFYIYLTSKIMKEDLFYFHLLSRHKAYDANIIYRYDPRTILMYVPIRVLLGTLILPSEEYN